MRWARVTVIGLVTVLVCAIWVLGAVLGGTSAQAAPATCTTFNATNEPTSSFQTGEKIVVRGTGFGAGSLVLVSLQQDTRTAEIGSVNANDLGAFTLASSAVPDSAAAGQGVIRALDARGSATCAITLREAAAAKDDGMKLVYLIWGGLLVVFGAILAVLTFRRWKNQQLRDAVEGFQRRDVRDEYEDLPPLPIVHERPITFERPSVDDGLVPSREPEVVRAGREEVVRVADDVLLHEEFAITPTRKIRIDYPGYLDELDDERPDRQTSDAIARLRREVKSWKDQ